MIARRSNAQPIWTDFKHYLELHVVEMSTQNFTNLAKGLVFLTNSLKALAYLQAYLNRPLSRRVIAGKAVLFSRPWLSRGIIQSCIQSHATHLPISPMQSCNWLHNEVKKPTLMLSSIFPFLLCNSRLCIATNTQSRDQLGGTDGWNGGQGQGQRGQRGQRTRQEVS